MHRFCCIPVYSSQISEPSRRQWKNAEASTGSGEVARTNDATASATTVMIRLALCVMIFHGSLLEGLEWMLGSTSKSNPTPSGIAPCGNRSTLGILSRTEENIFERNSTTRWCSGIYGRDESARLQYELQ